MFIVSVIMSNLSLEKDIFLFSHVDEEGGVSFENCPPCG